MKNLSKRLEEQISKTKGELNDVLCDSKIAVDTMVDGNIEEFTKEEIHFLIASVNHFKEEIKRVNEFYISTITTLSRVEVIAILDGIHDKLKA